jgi:extradiol dioxygenase family protein
VGLGKRLPKATQKSLVTGSSFGLVLSNHKWKQLAEQLQMWME